MSTNTKAPVLVKDELLDGRGTKFGKTVIDRYFQMPNGKVIPILCITTSGVEPVIVFAISDEGKIFLIRQFRFGTNDWMIELPGGCKKPGQSYEDTARAELLEETGVEATKIEIIGRPLAFNPALEDAKVIAAVATGCKVVGDQSLEDMETATVLEVTVAEFRRMAKTGEIGDAKTVAIGYLALDHLGFLG